MTTTPQLISKENISAWAIELQHLEANLTSLDREAADLAAPAELGDQNAVEARDKILEDRKCAAQRAQNLRAAIDSGNAHLQKQADTEKETERQAQAVLAEELKGVQMKAAKRVDKALAQLEAASAEYFDAAEKRGMAVRAAGGKWSHGYLNCHLEQAVYGSAPEIARKLKVNWELSRHAARLQDLVQ